MCPFERATVSARASGTTRSCSLTRAAVANPATCPRETCGCHTRRIVGRALSLLWLSPSLTDTHDEPTTKSGGRQVRSHAAWTRRVSIVRLSSLLARWRVASLERIADGRQGNVDRTCGSLTLPRRGSELRPGVARRDARSGRAGGVDRGSASARQSYAAWEATFKPCSSCSKNARA